MLILLIFIILMMIIIRRCKASEMSTELAHKLLDGGFEYDNYEEVCEDREKKEIMRGLEFDFKKIEFKRDMLTYFALNSAPEWNEDENKVLSIKGKIEWWLESCN